jgi:hypothetical protein
MARRDGSVLRLGERQAKFLRAGSTRHKLKNHDEHDGHETKASS